MRKWLVLVVLVVVSGCGNGGGASPAATSPAPPTGTTSTASVDEVCAAYATMSAAHHGAPSLSDVDAFVSVLQSAAQTPALRAFVTLAGLSYAADVTQGQDLLNARALLRQAAAAVDQTHTC